MQNRFWTALIVGCLVTGAASAKEPIRLDASSDAAAEASWQQMVESVGPRTKQKLLIAMLQINLAGVSSAYEIAGNPDLQRIGIARVKNKISNLSADEIIELGNRMSSIQVPTIQ